MNSNNVLCAVDVNDFDQEVIDLAATFAKHFGVDLSLLHVTLFPDPSHAVWPAYLRAPTAISNESRLLEKIKTNVKDVEVTYHQLSGIPEKEIIGFVDRNSPQLLVLGTHARRGLERILGSVSSNVMRKVNCPVLILRQKLGRTVSTQPPPT